MTTTRKNRDPFALRDLEWVVSSPFLLRDPPSPNLGRDAETIDLMCRLRADPTPLLDHLATIPRLNLGRYFEQLVIFWLTSLPAVRLLASNMRISAEKRTLGELDLIFEHDKQAYHWELAVKFYLNIGRGEKEADYVGPQLKDTLKRKLDRLFGHQLMLPSQAETIAALDKLGVRKITSYPYVKGRLFHELRNMNDKEDRPHRIAETAHYSSWLPASQVEETALPAFDHFRVLEKDRWLTPYFYREEAEKGNCAALQNTIERRFQHRPAPQLVALFREEGKDKLVNSGRVFITPEDWPGLARKTHNRQELGD